MMKGMLKRALGVVAAAAMAVTGAVALSGTANAADGGESTGAAVTTGTVKTCTGGVTVTFHADHEEQLQNARFSVYKLADYVEYKDKNNSVYGVQTSQKTDEGLTAVKGALNKAVGNEYPVTSAKDPMAWLMGQANGTWQDDGSWGYQNGVAASKVRKFADNLDTSKLTAASGYTVNYAVKAQDGSVTRSITGLDAGVYLFTVVSGNAKVTSTVPMIVSTGTYSNGVLDPCQVAQVEIKNNVLTDQTKVAGAESASIGDEIEYLLSGQVPATAVGEFKFTDKPGVGLTIRKGTIKVYATNQRVTDENRGSLLVEKNLLTADTDYTVSWNDLTAVDANDNATTDVIDGYKAVTDQTPTTKNQTFEVRLTTPGSHQNQWITVVYTARVNDDVDLEDGIVNDLYNKGEWKTTTTEMYGFTIDKRNTDKEAIPGVTFQIKDKTGNVLRFVPMTASNQVAGEKDAVAYYRKAAHDNTTGAVTELTTDANGKIVVRGLGEGVYNVVETDNGDYMDVYADFKVTIGANGTVSVTSDDANKLATKDSVNGTTVTVINARNITELPKTGAAGITMFVVLGLLIAGAGALVYMKSRNIRKAMR